MQPTVAIAYGNPNDLQLERDILQAIDANLVYINGLNTPESQAIISSADALMVTTHLVPADMIASMERCRVISRAGTGLDAIDLAAAAARGVWQPLPDGGLDLR